MVAATLPGTDALMTAIAKREGPRFATAGRLAVQVFANPADVEAEWRHLEATGIGTHFQRYDWVDAWIATAGRASAVRPAILYGQLAGVPAFVLPLGLRRSGPVTIAECLGGTHSGYNGGVWSAEGATYAGALPPLDLAACLGQALDADAVMLRRLPADIGGVPQPLRALESLPSAVSGYSVSLAGGMDAVLARTGGGARRRRANQKERRLREMGALEHGRARDLAAALADLDFFEREKALRLAAQGLANPFAEPGAMAFLRELVRRSEGLPEPLLAMHDLSLDGAPRAVIGAGVHRGRALLQILTYAHDETQPHSPGQVLLYRHIEASAAAGCGTYDFGVGQELYKDSWKDADIALRDHWAAFSAAGRAAIASMRLRAQARSALRRNTLVNRLVKTWRRRDAAEAGA